MQGGVFVGPTGQGLVYEQVARNGQHGVEHPLIANALGAQTLHHGLTQTVGIQAQIAGRAGYGFGLRRPRQSAGRYSRIAIGGCNIRP